MRPNLFCILAKRVCGIPVDVENRLSVSVNYVIVVTDSFDRNLQMERVGMVHSSHCFYRFGLGCEQMALSTWQAAASAHVVASWHHMDSHFSLPCGIAAQKISPVVTV